MKQKIHEFYKKYKRLLKDLQRSTDERKKRWLVFLSAAAMIFVIILWMFYLNLTLPHLPKLENAGTSQNNPPSASREGESFFQTFGRGIKIAFDKLGGEISAIIDGIAGYVNDFKAQIQKNNEFSFDKSRENFLPQNPEPIPTTTLP